MGQANIQDAIEVLKRVESDDYISKDIMLSILEAMQTPVAEKKFSGYLTEIPVIDKGYRYMYCIKHKNQFLESVGCCECEPTPPVAGKEEEYFCSWCGHGRVKTLKQGHGLISQQEECDKRRADFYAKAGKEECPKCKKPYEEIRPSREPKPSEPTLANDIADWVRKNHNNHSSAAHWRQALIKYISGLVEAARKEGFKQSESINAVDKESLYELGKGIAIKEMRERFNKFTKTWNNGWCITGELQNNVAIKGLYQELFTPNQGA